MNIAQDHYSCWGAKHAPTFLSVLTLDVEFPRVFEQSPLHFRISCSAVQRLLVVRRQRRVRQRRRRQLAGHGRRLKSSEKLVKYKNNWLKCLPVCRNAFWCKTSFLLVCLSFFWPSCQPANMIIILFVFPSIHLYVYPGNNKGGKYHCTFDLLFDWFVISCMTTDNFYFYLQNRLI